MIYELFRINCIIAWFYKKCFALFSLFVLFCFCCLLGHLLYLFVLCACSFDCLFVCLLACLSICLFGWLVCLFGAFLENIILLWTFFGELQVFGTLGENCKFFSGTFWEIAFLRELFGRTASFWELFGRIVIFCKEN